MQKISVANGKFLEGYSDVLRHHVQCILKSGMILDEDMNLLMTFWDPSLLPSPISTRQHFLFTSTTFATAGLITSLKLQSPYPIALSLLPTTLHFISKAIYRYRERNFKKNFNDLLQILTEIYRSNKEISQYYIQRDLAVQNNKLRVEAYNLLIKPGQDFLKFAIVELLNIIEKIKQAMMQVCEFVPISEGQFICSLEWSLEDFKVFNGDDFSEMKSHFGKLSDLYLLITSNFLSCVGLSMCVQLWKEPCRLQNVLTELIPSLSLFLVKSRRDVQNRFNSIRFNLCDRATRMENNERGMSVSNRFSKPLHEFLLHVQITFDKGRHLQLLLEHEHDNIDSEELVEVLKDASKHVEISKDCLRILTHRIDVFAGRNKVRDESIDKVSLLTMQTLDVESVTCEDPIELKDEEYNLSIHGSDNDCLDYIEELDDISSNEDLGTLLLELKKKLQEKHVQVQEDAPIRVPIPSPPKLPVVNHSNDINSLLKTVMLTAQNLNRSEEVFGSGSISNSDSDDS